MELRTWALIGAGAGFTILLVALAFAVQPEVSSSAPQWNDASPQGHSGLTDRLSVEGPVRIFESSMGTFPNDAGEGDVLFLFPTHRPASPSEISSVEDFLQAGGVVVMAADGGNADGWTARLGFRFQGIPALLAPGGGVDCVNATVPVPRGDDVGCLPSPTVLPNVTQLITDPERTFDQTGSTHEHVFLDLTGDSTLSLGDQGPLNATVSFSLSLGEGTLYVISDGDLWRNEVVEEHPSNIDLAARFAEAMSDEGTIYVDSSEAGTRTSALVGELYRAYSAPSYLQFAGVGMVLAGLVVGSTRVPRVIPWMEHDPPDHPVDDETEALILEKLNRAHSNGDTDTKPLGPIKDSVAEQDTKGES